ncbi:AbrB/MazE/SpoVT family DNA-binding domain-containing protein [Lactobacillus sp. XV13L]|nr:AbrB/MazE/SpoVT family DNA-binding domain-containing protein [Lactobacillus sp. XV13L]
MKTKDGVTFYAKISNRYQLVIPKGVRYALGINSADGKVVFKVKNNKVELSKPQLTEADVWEKELSVRKKYHITGQFGSPEIDWGEDVGDENLNE